MPDAVLLIPPPIKELIPHAIFNLPPLIVEFKFDAELQ